MLIAYEAYRGKWTDNSKSTFTDQSLDRIMWAIELDNKVSGTTHWTIVKVKKQDLTSDVHSCHREKFMEFTIKH